MAATDIPPTEQEVGRAFEAAIVEADERRVGGLRGLALARAARASALEREAVLMQAQEDPRARSVAEQLAANRSVMQQLGVEAKRAEVRQPTPREDAWTLHGHVLNDRLEGVAGATVHLVDRKGKRVRGGGGTTDDGGYFRFEYPVREVGEGSQAEVFLRVVAGRARVLHEETEPLKPVSGAVEFAEIVLQGKSA
jgi:hypothetical protein